MDMGVFLGTRLHYKRDTYVPKPESLIPNPFYKPNIDSSSKEPQSSVQGRSNLLRSIPPTVKAPKYGVNRAVIYIQ